MAEPVKQTCEKCLNWWNVDPDVGESVEAVACAYCGHEQPFVGEEGPAAEAEPKSEEEPAPMGEGEPVEPSGEEEALG
jgi:hypothetical protein